MSGVPIGCFCAYLYNVNKRKAIRMTSPKNYLKSLIAAFTSCPALESVQLSAEQQCVYVTMRDDRMTVALDYADWNDTHILEVTDNATEADLDVDDVSESLHKAVAELVKGKWHTLSDKKISDIGGYGWNRHDGDFETEVVLKREKVLAAGFSLDKLWLNDGK